MSLKWYQTLNGCSVPDDDPVVVRHRPVELSVYYVVVVHSLRFEETSLEWYVVLVSAAGDLGALEVHRAGRYIKILSGPPSS